MNTNAFPYRVRWTSEQIADAVPLRLVELVAAAVAAAPRAGNDARAERARTWRGAYRARPALPALMQVH